MGSGGQPHTIRCRLLIRAPGDTVANGCLLFQAGRIQYAGRWLRRKQEGPVTHYPDAVVTPGLVNAHTHLHLGFLSGEVKRCRSFTGWLMQLAHRSLGRSGADHRRGWGEGVARSLAAGMTTVADICSRWNAASWHRSSPLRTVAFLELVGLSPETVPRTMSKARQELRGLTGHDLLYPGLAPHAPYSTSKGLVCSALRLGRDRGVPLAVHVAESRAERQMLEDGSGELAARLRFFRALPRHWKPTRCSPVELLADWGILDSGALLVHCNRLSPSDIGLLERAGNPVVYCPRSSRFFGVHDHPWKELRRRGVLVALGTDSLASSPSLSILEEMRFLAVRHPEVSPEELFSMGTAAGAQALGLGGEVGVLRRGYAADLAVWSLPEVRPRNALEALIREPREAQAVYVSGRHVRPVVNE